MEQEFALAKKRQERERERVVKERQARLERERRGRAEFDKAEQYRLEQVQVRQAQERARLAQLEAEALNNGGIVLVQSLRPVPMPSLETDRVRLPHSMFARLLDLGAIKQGQVLTFELCWCGESGRASDAVLKTHVGVSEFTAEEGTIEVPIKVALSLGGGGGDQQEFLGSKLRVRLVQIDHASKVRCRIQPKGDGFHLNDQQVVQLDLKRVLERALRLQTCISVGDCIPIRHEGRTFVLVVKDLYPDSPALLIDTDLEVDMMPCENVENKALLERQLELELRQWKERCLDLHEGLPAEPLVTEAGAVTFKARIPGASAVHVRRFDKRVSTVQQVFDWATSLLPAPPPRGGNGSWLEIVLGPGKALVAGDVGLVDAGLGSSQALNFRWREQSVGSVDDDAVAATASAVLQDQVWTASLASAEQVLDKDLLQQQEEEEDGMQVEGDEAAAASSLSKVEVFKLLVALGAEPQRCALVAQKYHACLLTIHRLGLMQPNQGQLVVELVDKYKGSTSRIADAIVQAQQQQEQPPRADWTEQLQLLQAMFTDRNEQEIRDALSKHRGSVERAANELLMG